MMVFRAVIVAAILASTGSWETAEAASRHKPVVVHTEPCLYPDGWNVGDYWDDIAGRPKDRDHQCVVGPGGQLLDSQGQPTQ